MGKTTTTATQVDTMEHACFLILDKKEVGAKILLVQERWRDGRQPLWKLPGGKGENFETVEETIAREVREEIGLNIQKAQCVFQTVIEEPEYRFLVFAVFDPAVKLDWLRLNPDEISLAAFFDEWQIKEFIKDRLIPQRHAIAIEEYLRAHCY